MLGELSTAQRQQKSAPEERSQKEHGRPQAAGPSDQCGPEQRRGGAPGADHFQKAVSQSEASGHPLESLRQLVEHADSGPWPRPPGLKSWGPGGLESHLSTRGRTMPTSWSVPEGLRPSPFRVGLQSCACHVLLQCLPPNEGTQHTPHLTWPRSLERPP